MSLSRPIRRLSPPARRMLGWRGVLRRVLCRRRFFTTGLWRGSLRAGMSDTVRAALGDEEDRRARAEGAALDPWRALDDGLTAVGVTTPA